jgi:hypothetical protein
MGRRYFLVRGRRDRPVLLVRAHRRGRRVAVELELRGEPVFSRDEDLAPGTRFRRLGLSLRVGGDDRHALDLDELLLHLGEISTHEHGVDLRSLRVLVGEDDEPVGARLGESLADGATFRLAALAIRHDPSAQRREQRNVTGQHPEFPSHARRRHLVDRGL